MADQKICDRCGHNCPSEALYCLFCGNRFEVTKECPHCVPKLFYKANVIYCLKCGEELVVSKAKIKSKPKNVAPKNEKKEHKIEIEIDDEKEKKQKEELERKLSTYVEPTIYNDGIYGNLEVAITKQALIDYNEEQKKIKERQEKLLLESRTQTQSAEQNSENDITDKVKVLECNDDFCTIHYIPKETYASSINPDSCTYVPGEHSKIVKTKKARKSLIESFVCCWVPIVGIILSVKAIKDSAKVGKEHIIFGCIALILSIVFTIGELILLKIFILENFSLDVIQEDEKIQSIMTDGSYNFGHNYSYSKS